MDQWGDMAEAPRDGTAVELRPKIEGAGRVLGSFSGGAWLTVHADAPFDTSIRSDGSAFDAFRLIEKRA